jgi:hypothetical protein
LRGSPSAEKIAPAMPLPLDLAELAFVALVILVAAYVRGFAGFGFALISVPSLALLLPPSEIVPALFLTSLGTAAHLVPRVWREVHWRSVAWMLVGAVAATPVGVALLSLIPAAEMRIAIAVVVLVTALLLWHGFALKVIPGPGPALATGLASGFLNGSAGIGGPPVILFYFSSPAAGACHRRHRAAGRRQIDADGRTDRRLAQGGRAHRRHRGRSFLQAQRRSAPGRSPAHRGRAG